MVQRVANQLHEELYLSVSSINEAGLDFQLIFCYGASNEAATSKIVFK